MKQGVPENIKLRDLNIQGLGYASRLLDLIKIRNTLFYK